MCTFWPSPWILSENLYTCMINEKWSKWPCRSTDRSWRGWQLTRIQKIFEIWWTATKNIEKKISEIKNLWRNSPLAVILFSKLVQVSNFFSEIWFFSFPLLLFIKILVIFWIRLSCHPFHDMSKTCNFYRVTFYY